MICSCGSQYIVNKRYNLCYECNFKRLHKGLSSFEYKLLKQKENIKKRTKKKNKGEKELFLEIWNEKAHYCENKKCNKWLGHEPKAIFFSHRKPKSIYPELRLDKNNIDLLCQDCHWVWDFGDRKKIEL